MRSCEEIIIKSFNWGAVRTGLAIEIPQGFHAEIRPRSGLALKSGITVLNSPGTIDSDYRGEVLIILANFSKDDFIVQKGDRIAQMVITESQKAAFVRFDSLSSTRRGDGGFGHTGIN